MKRLILFILTSFLVHQPAAEGAAAIRPLEALGQPFYSRTIQISWNLKTNPLPKTVRIFKILPSRLSPQTISNLITLAAGTDFHIPPGGPSLSTDGTLALREKQGPASLTILPGAIELRAPSSSILSPTNVPNTSRASDLGQNILTLLDIPRDDLIKKADGELKPSYYSGETTRHDKQTRRPITTRNLQGITFRRQLDNIPCGDEQIRMEFCNNENLTLLKVDWHALEPSLPFATATTDQLALWIKEGRTRVQSAETTGSRWIKPQSIKNLTINSIEPHYTGPTYFPIQSFSQQPSTHLYPYAVITAQADLENGEHETIYLFTSITSGALMQISRSVNRDGFAVEPDEVNPTGQTEDK